MLFATIRSRILKQQCFRFVMLVFLLFFPLLLLAADKKDEKPPSLRDTSSSSTDKQNSTKMQDVDDADDEKEEGEEKEEKEEKKETISTEQETTSSSFQDDRKEAVDKQQDTSSTVTSNMNARRYKRRLFLGEASFSYTVAFLKKHEWKHPELAKYITSTELVEESNLNDFYSKDEISSIEFEKKYPKYYAEGVLESKRPYIEFRKNMETLEQFGVKPLFGIDATKIDEQFAGQRFERIHFNFPHDGKGYMDTSTRTIVTNFFQSAAKIQELGDRIHVVLPLRSKEDKNGNDYFHQVNTYGIYGASADAGYKLIKKRRFTQCNEKEDKKKEMWTRYLGYKHCQTKSSSSAAVAETSREYVFEKTSLSPEEIRKRFPPLKKYEFEDCLPERETDDDSSDYTRENHDEQSTSDESNNGDFFSSVSLSSSSAIVSIAPTTISGSLASFSSSSNSSISNSSLNSSYGKETKNPTSKAQKSNSKSFITTRDLYDDNMVNRLIDLYFGELEEGRMDAININAEGGDVFLQNLIQREQRIRHLEQATGVATPHLVIPINLGPYNINMPETGIHWAGLYIRRPTTYSPADIFYFDPLGNTMPLRLRIILCNMYQHPNIVVNPIRFQFDGYNCGPWIIEIFRHLVEQGQLPSKNFDINSARRRHLAVSSRVTATNLLSASSSRRPSSFSSLIAPSSSFSRLSSSSFAIYNPNAFLSNSISSSLLSSSFLSVSSPINKPTNTDTTSSSAALHNTASVTSSRTLSSSSSLAKVTKNVPKTTAPTSSSTRTSSLSSSSALSSSSSHLASSSSTTNNKANTDITSSSAALHSTASVTSSRTLSSSSSLTRTTSSAPRVATLSSSSSPSASSSSTTNDPNVFLPSSISSSLSSNSFQSVSSISSNTISNTSSIITTASSSSSSPPFKKRRITSTIFSGFSH